LGTDDIVTVSNSVDFFNFYPRGYTVSAWVNMPPKTSGAWGAFVSKQQREDGADWKGFILTHQVRVRRFIHCVSLLATWDQAPMSMTITGIWSPGPMMPRPKWARSMWMAP
jgi:hypothetical protein